MKACTSVSDCDTISHTRGKRINYFELLDPENLSKTIVINHKGYTYHVLQHFVDVLRIYSSFIYIHNAAFRNDDVRFTNIVEGIFLMDMMFSFFTDYVDP